MIGAYFKPDLTILFKYCVMGKCAMHSVKDPPRLRGENLFGLELLEFYSM